MPKGAGILCLVQLVSVISFAVLFASLALYMKHTLGFSQKDATLITGIYFACNFALHQLSGYLAGRFLSYRFLALFGLIFQALGTLALAQGDLHWFFWGLACMLVGTGTLVTCVNMLLSQLFDRDDVSRRESAFLWNYSAMNIGFFLGFSITGYFQLQNTYIPLFLTALGFNVLSVFILISGWRSLRDRDTALMLAQRSSIRLRHAYGIAIVCLLVPFLHFLLQHASLGDVIILSVGAVMVAVLIMGILRHRGEERDRFIVFLVLLLCTQIFWVIYQLAPMSLMFFATNNVDLHIFGFTITTGWLSNINALTIFIGGPLLARYFRLKREKTNARLSVSAQYTFGLTLAGLGLLALPLGIVFAHEGYVQFPWLFITYFTAAVAELFISPIGYAMVGQLVPVRWQSLCMGSILLNNGVAAVFASFFSNYASGYTDGASPLVTNPSYSRAFLELGGATLGIAIILIMLTPWLNRRVYGNARQLSERVNVDLELLNEVR